MVNKRLLVSSACFAVVAAVGGGWSGSVCAQEGGPAPQPSLENKFIRPTVKRPKSKLKVHTRAVAPKAAAAQPTSAGASTPADDGKFSLSGSIRMRTTINYNDVNRRTERPDSATYIGIDGLSLNPKYDSSTLFASAQYNIYGGAYPYSRAFGYKEYFGEMSFLKFAYAGYKFGPDDTLTVGLQQVPFGLMPYFSTAYFETIGALNQMEEFYKVGIKYSHVEADLNYQLGFFPADGGSYFGISRDSARYSADFVKADSYLTNGSSNGEQYMLVARGEYRVYKSDLASATFGLSAIHSSIYNYDTRQYGQKMQEAVHFVGTYGDLTFKSLVGRLDINPKNPGGANALVTLGSFDGAFNVASHGTLVSAELAYRIAFAPETLNPFSEVTPYADYSAYYKDRRDFKDTERYTVGAALTLRAIPGVYIYTEARFGRNDPYTGAGQYSQGMGAGGDNKWKTAYYTNIGYYW